MHHLLHWSIAALLAGNTLDSASSYGKYETNPLLGQHTFNSTSIAIKFGMVGALVAGEKIYLHKHPEHATLRTIEIVNFTSAALLTGVAVRNWREVK